MCRSRMTRGLGVPQKTSFFTHFHARLQHQAGFLNAQLIRLSHHTCEEPPNSKGKFDFSKFQMLN